MSPLIKVKGSHAHDSLAAISYIWKLQFFVLTRVQYTPDGLLAAWDSVGLHDH
jgi:hypothetical protein